MDNINTNFWTGNYAKSKSNPNQKERKMNPLSEIKGRFIKATVRSRVKKLRDKQIVEKSADLYRDTVAVIGESILTFVDQVASNTKAADLDKLVSAWAPIRSEINGFVEKHGDTFKQIGDAFKKATKSSEKPFARYERSLQPKIKKIARDIQEIFPELK